jgi:hypothetical protein
MTEKQKQPDVLHGRAEQAAAARAWSHPTPVEAAMALERQKANKAGPMKEGEQRQRSANEADAADKVGSMDAHRPDTGKKSRRK